MGAQEIIAAIVITVAGGLLLDLVKNGLAHTKKLLSNAEGLLLCMFRLPKRFKSLVYLSSGGTCRDPMVKVITEQILKGVSLPFKVKIEARALGPISGPSASYAAKIAIKEIFGKNLLISHKPKMATRELLDEADLVLVMDKSLMISKILPKHKTYLFKEFFGSSGDVVDPYPDGKDQATISRYRECAEEMKTIIEENFDRLIQALQA